MDAGRHVSNHDVLKEALRNQESKKKQKKKQKKTKQKTHRRVSVSAKMWYVPFSHAPTIVIICRIVRLPYMLMPKAMRPGQAYTSAFRTV